MRRSTAVLSVALGVSLLINILSFRHIQRSRSPSEETARRPAETQRADLKAEATALKGELEREQTKNRELKAKIELLQADRDVLAQAATTGAPGAATVKSPTAGLREKLRKMKKLFKAAEEGVQPDQEAVLEMSGEIMEVMKLGLARSKDPRTYAEFFQTCTEVALEDGSALTPAQSADLSRILQEMADGLGQIPAQPSGERLIRELEIESAAFGRLQSLLTPEQKQVLMKGGMDDLPTMSSGMNTTYLAKVTAVDTIIKAWTQAYQLQDAQQPAARAAAQVLLQSLEGVDPGLKPGQQGPEANWGQMTYESRITSLRSQLMALKTLEGAMTGAQLDRLRTQSMKEFRLLEYPVTTEVPEKK